jgi:hypothetical protein
MPKTNKAKNKPVIDPKKAGLPSTTDQKSGTGRANVKPPPKAIPPKKKS